MAPNCFSDLENDRNMQMLVMEKVAHRERVCECDPSTEP